MNRIPDTLVPKGDIRMPRSVPSLSRRFEFIAGTSCKFWEVRVDGKEVTVCFGRIGAAGQSQTKFFPDATAASQHAAQLIEQKRAKGYPEVRSPHAA
jgi:predicted DNA-binding WGR domain protein